MISYVNIAKLGLYRKLVAFVDVNNCFQISLKLIR